MVPTFAAVVLCEFEFVTEFLTRIPRSNYVVVSFSFNGESFHPLLILVDGREVTRGCVVAVDSGEGANFSPLVHGGL